MKSALRLFGVQPQPSKSSDQPEAPKRALVDTFSRQSGLQGNVHAVATPAAQSKTAVISRHEVITATLDDLDADAVGLDDDQHLRLRFALEDLPAYYRDALGLHDDLPLVIRVTLVEPKFGGMNAPLLKVSVGDNAPLVSNSKATTPWDKLTYQVKQIVHRFAQENWPPQSRQAARRFLSSLYHHVAARLIHLGDFCVVCDAPQKVPGLKPVPCDSPACNFAYDEMGIGAGVSEIYNRPEVADLLISMATAATLCEGVRREQLFASVPHEFLGDAQAGGRLGKAIRWGALIAAFDSLPSVKEMAENEDLAAFLRSKNPAAFKLVRWVLNTNRGHLMLLSPQERFQAMDTPHQFRLCTSTPAREQRFAALKKAHGSAYYFHGSGFYNWHSILRESLKNCSNTSLMSAGAAYGAGIYLASESGTSEGYARSSAGFKQSLFGTNLRCLALCEVIKGSGSGNHGILVVPDEERVITRYLFVYGAQSIPYVKASDLGAVCESHAKVIDEALKTLASVKSAAPPHDDLRAAREAVRALTTSDLPPAPSETSEGSWDSLGSDDDASYTDSSNDDYSLYDEPEISVEQKAEQVAHKKIDAAIDARFASHISTGAQQRLLKDLRALGRMNTRPEGFELSPVDDNLSLWEAKIWCDTDCSLGVDLKEFGKRHGRDYVTLRMRFGANYPTEPPFVWVVSPVFMPQTGFVSRGAVCTNMLLTTGTDSGWSPVYTGEHIVRQIRANFHLPDAKGRIQDLTHDQAYTEAQARDGWEHAKGQHGWR